MLFKHKKNLRGNKSRSSPLLEPNSPPNFILQQIVWPQLKKCLDKFAAPPTNCKNGKNRHPKSNARALDISTVVNEHHSSLKLPPTNLPLHLPKLKRRLLEQMRFVGNAAVDLVQPSAKILVSVSPQPHRGDSS